MTIQSKQPSLKMSKMTRTSPTNKISEVTVNGSTTVRPDSSQLQSANPRVAVLSPHRRPDRGNRGSFFRTGEIPERVLRQDEADSESVVPRANGRREDWCR